MIIVSSISSTPERNLFAKTGGTERTIDALTERNSSFSFSLRALLGEPSTSMGTGEVFRFIFDGHWTGPQGKSNCALVGPKSSRIWRTRHTPRSRWRWALALHSLTVFPACHQLPV